MLSIEKIQNSLKNELPGKAAQLLMAPEMREISSECDSCKKAAVLILIYPEGDSLKTVFMKRNEYDGPHSGQISFPGGMREENDKDLIHTALRESHEELGINDKDVKILGQLTSLHIPVSNFCVTPFIGWINYTPEFRPDPSEVQYLITPDLSLMADPKIIKTHVSSSIKYPYYSVHDEVIWGATAMMFSEFNQLTNY